MKSLNEMRLEVENIEKDLRNMKNVCITEGREPNDEEVEKANGLLARVDQLDELIALEARRTKLESRFAEPADPEKTQKVLPQPVEPIQKRANKAPFSSLGEQMQAVMRAGTEGRVDPRLHEVRAASGLSEGIGGDGGFLLQPQYSSELLKVAFDTGIIAKMCRRVPMSSNQLIIPGLDETSRINGSRGGGTRHYWVAEAAEKTKSQAKYRRIELNAAKCVVLTYATDELLEDVGAMESYIRESAIQEIGFAVDSAIIEGSGAGQPLGIKNAGCLVSQGAETGQAATTFIYENATKMWSRLFPRSQTNAVWLINQNVWPQLFTMNLAVGTGGAPVFMPAGGASASPYATLFGRPVMPIEQCETLGTLGDVYLADFRNGYILGEKGGIKSDMSIHVRFVYDESVFRWVFRLDGQPILASAITPYKGGTSYTQSHFIGLATRS